MAQRNFLLNNQWKLLKAADEIIKKQTPQKAINSLFSDLILKMLAIYLS